MFVLCLLGRGLIASLSSNKPYWNYRRQQRDAVSHERRQQRSIVISKQTPRTRDLPKKTRAEDLFSFSSRLHCAVIAARSNMTDLNDVDGGGATSPTERD